MTEILARYSVEFDPAFLERKRAYTGKILHIDLTNLRFWLEEPDEIFYRKLIGGRGFVLHYLLSQMPAKADPLGPDNILIFASGVLTGTILPGSGRHGVGAKSPLTGALASGEAGGWWGHELKRAGLDALVLHGRAQAPVYISSDDGKVEIRSAIHLWGQHVADADEAIKQEIGNKKAHIALIGIAGENLVRYASIMHDINRTAGRSGLGAVMGSKNLKAVAVAGNKTGGIANKDCMRATLKWITESYKESMGWLIGFGTPGSVGPGHDTGGMQLRNFTAGSLDNIDDLRAENMFSQIIKDRDTCSHCPVKCKLRAKYTGKRYRIDPRYGGPEYESIGALGPLCAVDDAVAVSKANELCAAYGLDTISTGATIAFTMECAENELLDDYDFQPSFGDANAMVEAVHKIAKREGLGTLMAEGSAAMAAEFGPEAKEFIAVSKSQELPLHDPRQKNIAGMGYALSPTGADHQHNLVDAFANFPESDNCSRLNEMGLETPLPLFGISDHKVLAYAYESAFRHMLDSAVICHFYPYKYKHIAEALGAAGGWVDLDIDEIDQIGKRIVTMGRLLLLREGFTHADDNISPRVLQPTKDGPIKGKTIKHNELADGIQKYYQIMGWDSEGVPSFSTLDSLDLNEYAFN